MPWHEIPEKSAGDLLQAVYLNWIRDNLYFLKDSIPESKILIDLHITDDTDYIDITDLDINNDMSYELYIFGHQASEDEGTPSIWFNGNHTSTRYYRKLYYESNYYVRYYAQRNNYLLDYFPYNYDYMIHGQFYRSYSGLIYFIYQAYTNMEVNGSSPFTMWHGCININQSQNNLTEVEFDGGGLPWLFNGDRFIFLKGDIQ
jgi:hypothetical protein